MNKNNTIKAIVLSSIFVSLSVTSAEACTTVNDMHYIFSNQQPKQVSDADFIGKIKVTKIGNENDGTVATAVVQASETHPDLIGKNIQLTYLETSCGPYVNKGDKGHIAGTTSNLKADADILVVQPHVSKFDWTQLQIPEEQNNSPLGEIK